MNRTEQAPDHECVATPEEVAAFREAADEVVGRMRRAQGLCAECAECADGCYCAYEAEP